METLWRCAAQENRKQVFDISEIRDELDGERQVDD
jgi:hypothetical protein